MTERDHLLGIDAGTSVVKAALFDRGGREIAATMRRTKLQAPQPGWAEASMPETWNATIDSIRELLAVSGIAAEQIAGVGLSGNMIGAWLIDEQGEPVRNGIYWADGRTQTLIEQLDAERPGFMSEIFSYSASVMQQGCTMPLVRWLADHEPDNLARARYVLQCKDWLRYKLTGVIQTEQSEVGGLPGETRTQTYADDVFEILGIAEFRDKFAPIVPSEAIVGGITDEAAQLTGLVAGTPVAAGAGDVPAVSLGVGAVEPGLACSILGTTSINGLVVGEPIFEPRDIGLLFYIPHDRWLRALANVSGTTNLDWFIAQFCPVERDAATSQADLFARLESLAEQSRVGANGVLYHPYLSAVGVIAPIYEPAARAQFFGLTIDHTRADMLRAVYEGMALAIRDCYGAVDFPLDEIRLSGGGARSAYWSQIIADCVGVRVVVPQGSEFGAKGAALLAGVGIGWFDSIAEAAADTVTIARIHEPNRALRPIYDENYALYIDLRERLRPAWQQGVRRRML